MLSTQVLQEFFVTTTRKLNPPLFVQEAEGALQSMARLDVVHHGTGLIFRAFRLVRRHSLPNWDALIVAAAQSANCELLLTEDLQHGQQLGTLRIENPFCQADP